MKKLYFCFVLGFSLFILLLNLRLYSNPSADFQELSPHLSFLKESLEAGSANEMQTMFPEGYVFSYVLYGASWINLGIADPQQRDAAVREARWALAFLDSDTAKIPFRATVRPPLGGFYLGWTNWLRGGILKLDPAGPRGSAFKTNARSCPRPSPPLRALFLTPITDRHGLATARWPWRRWRFTTRYTNLGFSKPSKLGSLRSRPPRSTDFYPIRRRPTSRGLDRGRGILTTRSLGERPK